MPNRYMVLNLYDKDIYQLYDRLNGSELLLNKRFFTCRRMKLLRL